MANESTPTVDDSGRIITSSEDEAETDESGDSTGAVDHGFEENEKSAREELVQILAEVRRDIEPGDFAYDLIRNQVLYVASVDAETVVEHFEREAPEFNVATYNVNKYLNIDPDETVFNCYYVKSLRNLHKSGREYSFPRSRLVRIPVEEMVGDA